MSHEIIYTRQFVKLPDGRIIPMILHGSSNCYDSMSARGRRARHWDVCNMPDGYNHKIAFTPEELVEGHKQCLSDKAMFVIHGKWYDGKKWLTFIKNGIKGAKTLEELGRQGEMSMYFTVYKDNHGCKLTTPMKFARTSEDLYRFLAEYDELVRKRDPDERVYANLSFFREKFVLPKPPAKPKAKLDDFYLIEVGSSFIERLTPRKIYRTCNPESAKQFTTKAKAEKWLAERRLKSRLKTELRIYHYIKKGNSYELVLEDVVS